jgi:hypothetical protein
MCKKKIEKKNLRNKTKIQGENFFGKHWNEARFLKGFESWNFKIKLKILTILTSGKFIGNISLLVITKISAF